MLRHDPTRVLVRPFFPASEAPRGVHGPDSGRAARMVDRVLAMSQDAVEAELAATLGGFQHRHRDLRAALAERFDQVRDLVGEGAEVPVARRLLIGACFSHEYSFESAALFNPSIVPHPDQDGLPADELRFILSLRSVGEGHISSVSFRSGVVDADGEVRLDPPARHATEPMILGAAGTAGGAIDVAFAPGTPLAERVIFPVTLQQRNGIEDARFVRFVEDDGTVAYYATYTAYSGREIAPELLRTEDFARFRFLPVRGDAVRNKGMALFPRRVAGRYAMLARVDGESLQLVQSDDLGEWSGPVAIVEPREPWEAVQIGNCGSPVELPEGWLVLTHGVGPVRQHSIGAVLLDLEDPRRVRARLTAPLLAAEEGERDGYVPNMVYSCGALAHAGHLILPFAVADSATTFAAVELRALLAAMS